MHGREETAPDGSLVLPLVRGSGGSMARFTLPAGSTSTAVSHRSVEELWYVLDGRGELWTRTGEREQVTRLQPGTVARIVAGTAFQFRSEASEVLVILGVTMPPWPGPDEAQPAAGRW